MSKKINLNDKRKKLNARLRAAVLEILVNSPVTAKVVADEVGTYWENAKKHLDLLVSEGIVKVEVVGKLLIYRLNEEGDT